MQIQEYGLYIVSDSYFQDFPSDHWMWNKGQNRPHYYAFRDRDGTMWLIPLSSKVENYKAKIEREEARRGKGKCLYYYIGNAAGRQQAFIISGMMPILPKYIVKPFTIEDTAVLVPSSRLNRELTRKATTYLHLLEQNKLKDLNNVLQIRQALQNMQDSESST